MAETGTIVLVSNEGNARLTTALPRIHIAVMGGPGIHTVYLPGFAHETISHTPVSKVIAHKASR